MNLPSTVKVDIFKGLDEAMEWAVVKPTSKPVFLVSPANVADWDRDFPGWRDLFVGTEIRVMSMVGGQSQLAPNRKLMELRVAAEVRNE